MTNNLTNEQFYGIVIGPSVGGGCILLAAIVLAIVCYVRERKRRRATGHESSSSSTSLFRESRQHNNFRFPMFSTIQKDKKHGIDLNDVRYATGQQIQPRTEGGGKVFTIPITPSDSSKLSSPESSINKEPITTNNKNLTKDYNNTVTDKYFYQYDVPSRNAADTPTAPISSNPNTTQAISSSDITITTPITSIISPMMRRSRDIDHITSPQNHKQVVPPRNSRTSEISALQCLDSVLSVHEYDEPSNLMV